MQEMFKVLHAASVRKAATYLPATVAKRSEVKALTVSHDVLVTGHIARGPR